MKPSVTKELVTSIPTPLVGHYNIRLKAIDSNAVYAVIEMDNGKISRTTELPAKVSSDWLKYSRNEVVAITTDKVYTTTLSINIQDRVAYVNGKRVYINSRAESLPHVTVD